MNMKVLRLHATGQLKLQDEELPVLHAGEALVRVRAVGICGSDLHWLAEGGIGDARLEHALVLGHEFAGEVVSGALAGRRVAVDPAIPCGACEYCREGNPNFCERLRFAGHGTEDGALRDYVAWPEHLLHPLPEKLSLEDGAMLEPLGVALHAMDLGKVRSGMTIGVYGCGPIGLLIVQLAHMSGARQVITTDKLPHRLEMACELGAEAGILVRDGDEAKEVLSETGKHGVHVAFEVAGENAAVETAIETARSGGRVVLVGIPAEDRVGFPASTARRKGLTIKMCRRMKHTYPRAIDLVSRGYVDVRSLVTASYPLEKAEQAFASASRREGGKVMITP
jgi:L-iditol 2-dehydrogenase